MNRKQIFIVLGGLISVVFLYFSLQGQDWSKIRAAFGEADYRWLIPAAVLVLADYAFRAWRWGIILKPAAGQHLSMKTLFPVLLLGFAANNILPARAGEVWRMWGLSQRTSVRKSVALSTLVVERVFDGFTLVFLLAVAGAIHPLTGDATWIANIALLLFGAVFVGILLFVFLEDWTIRTAARFMWFIPNALRDRLLDMMGRFAQGLHALRQPSALLGIMGTSVLAWGCQALSFAAILMAFGATTALGGLISASILMLALVNLFIMIPAGPGNVGTFETAGTFALSISGLVLTSETTVAIVVLTHALQWLLVTGVGVLFAAREGVSIARLNTTPPVEVEAQG